MSIDTSALNTFLQQKLTCSSISLIRVDIPQKETFKSGIGIRKSREALLIEWITPDGVKGYGECSCRPDPFYSDEFTDSSIQLIKKFVAPLLKVEQTLAQFMEGMGKIRGWHFTKAAVEAAAINVIEQQSGLSVLDALSGIKPLSEVPVGISMGIFSEFEKMRQKVAHSIEEEYSRLKFKISPETDIGFFDQINPILLSSGRVISFDANGSFGINDLDKLAYFVNTYDAVIEQPFSPGRYDVLLKAKKELPKLRICFDEEIKTIGDLIKLHHLGVLDEVNLKPGRVGGVLNSIEIIDYCEQHNIPCWIGGMFETGIGRTLNLRIASYLPNARAHDLSPSNRYFEEDILAPDIRMNKGLVDIEGLSECRIVPASIDKFTIERHTINAAS